MHMIPQAATQILTHWEREHPGTKFSLKANYKHTPKEYNHL